MYQKKEYSKNRKKILLALFKHSMDYTTLKDETKLSDPTLSKHLKDLVDSSIIEFKKDGRRKVYSLKESAFNTPELIYHLMGINAALKLLKGNDFKHSLSEILSFGDAVNSFLEVLSRMVVVKNSKLNGIEIYNEILSKMQADYEKLKNLGDEEHQKAIEESSLIYFALGPPFSYKWKNMIERLEDKKYNAES